MGPVDWLGAVLAAVLAIGAAVVWYGRVRDGRGRDGRGRMFPVALVQGLSALMLAHNFARIGADTLAAKPWLYWMQSGGIAVAFVIPALWIGYTGRGIAGRAALADGLFWLAVYLSLGTVFWALG